MATIKKAQMGKKVVSPSSKKKPTDQTRDEMGFPVSPIKKKKQQLDEQKMLNYKGKPKMKSGGKLKKAASGMTKLANMKKGGKSFPDLNKDGKITKADILKGRGVIAKKGAKMSKCKYGCK